MLNYNVKNLLGIRYYPNDDPDVNNIIRVIDVQNENKITILYRDGNTEKVNIDYFSNYTALDPDGIFSIAIVSVATDPKTGVKRDDVIVSYAKSLGKGEYNYPPDVICRQSISDVFYDYMNIKENNEYVGLCLTRDTCPENMDYNYMVACNDVIEGQLIRSYIDDSLSTILSMVNRKKVDHVLECLQLDHLKYIGVPYIGQKSVHGWCHDLLQLLLENNFEYEYNRIHDIIQIEDGPFDELFLIPNPNNEDTYLVKSEAINLFSNLFNTDMNNVIAVQYDNDIDLGKIKTKYFLLKDGYNDLYVISYLTKGEIRFSDIEERQRQEYNAIKQLSVLFNTKKYD